MTFRVEDYDHTRESIIVSADWEDGHDAATSFVQLLLSHGLTKSQCTKHMRKAIADLQAGANIVQVVTPDNYTVSINVLSKLGQSTPERQ